MDIIQSEVFQNITGGVIGLAGLVLLFISVSVGSFDRYGREALAGAGGFMIVVAVMRFASLFGIAGTAEIRLVNSLAALTVLLVISQAAFLGHKNGKL